jgi:hypothetical protein
MLAHDLKNLLTIVPDLQPMIKEANLEEDYPLDNKGGAIASYMRYQYRVKVAHKTDGLSPELIDRIEKAAQMYGITDQVKPFVERLEKYAQIVLNEAFANYNKIHVKTAQVNFEGKATGFANIPDLVKEAQELCRAYGDEITSSEVLRYAGREWFSKEAAVQALLARAQASGREVFTKVAQIVDKSMGEAPTHEEVMKVCDRITELDIKTGLSAKGFNIYKEAMINKEALRSALQIRVCGKQVPFEKISSLKGHIASYIGQDVADAMGNDPMTCKHVIETLPLGEQRILESMLKNV